MIATYTYYIKSNCHTAIVLGIHLLQLQADLDNGILCPPMEHCHQRRGAILIRKISVPTISIVPSLTLTALLAPDYPLSLGHRPSQVLHSP